MQELYRMQDILLFPSLPASLGPKVVAAVRVLSIGKIELCSYAKLNCLKKKIDI